GQTWARLLPVLQRCDFTTAAARGFGRTARRRPLRRRPMRGGLDDDRSLSEPAGPRPQALSESRTQRTVNILPRRSATLPKYTNCVNHPMVRYVDNCHL